MAARSTQSFSHHRKYVPGYHYLGVALLTITLILALVWLIREPGLGSITGLFGVASLVVTFYYARVFPVVLQDRVICLEERLRLARLLPPDLAGRVAEFRRGQLIGLRFASDGELPALARRVLAEGIRSRAAVKALIVEWRPDGLRV